MNLIGQKVAFTGTLTTMTRKQAQALLFSLGVEFQTYISKETTMLVVGALPVTLFQTETCTKKMIQANERIARGQVIHLLSEQEFFSIIRQRLTHLSII